MAGEQLRCLWPETKGFYTKHELGRLCSCLGYPSDLLLSHMHGLSKAKPSLRSECLKCLAGKPFAERTVKQLLDYKPLRLILEKRFNRYDAKYNIKVIRKTIWLLRHQKMSFEEISNSRIAFDVYCCEDDSGLPADIDTVLSALKMLDKVVSQSKLECEMQKQQHAVDLPSRIQLYEFFSLILIAHSANEIESEMSASSIDEQDTSDVSLPDLDQILMTSHQKKMAYLDQKYKLSLYREVLPTPIIIDSEHTVSPAPRRDLRALAKEQLGALSPSLELTQSQLHQVRGGHVVLSNEQHRVVESSFRLPSPSRKQESGQGGSERSHSRSSKRGQLQSPLKSPLAKLIKEVDSVASINQEEPMLNKKDCIKSVIKARKALQTSFSSISQQQARTSTSTDSLWRQEAMGSVLRRPSTAPELGGRERPWLFKPVVTSEELRQQQGRINDLRWASLRLTPEHTTPASLKVVGLQTPRKLSSRVRFHRPMEAADKSVLKIRAQSHRDNSLVPDHYMQ